jgi:outer membrane immunogenic protein
MKKILLSSAALVALAGSALAADLPSRKAAPAAPVVPLWTGFYAGLNAGYNFGTNSNVYSGNSGAPISITGFGGNPLAGLTVYPGVAPLALDMNKSNTQDGFIGGAQFGYNYQGFMSPNLVLGIETDIQGAGIRGESVSYGASSGTLRPADAAANVNGVNAAGVTNVQSGVDYLGTIRGRIGYLWTPTLLVYGTGGFAYGGAYANVTQSANVMLQDHNFPQFGQGYLGWGQGLSGGGRQSQLLTGWTAGGGLEWMFMPNWSLKGEATYWDLGRMNVSTSTFGLAPTPVYTNSIGWGRTSVSYSGVQAKAGINYHFTWGSVPVVASF